MLTYEDIPRKVLVRFCLFQWTIVADMIEKKNFQPAGPMFKSLAKQRAVHSLVTAGYVKPEDQEAFSNIIGLHANCGFCVVSFHEERVDCCTCPGRELFTINATPASFLNSCYWEGSAYKMFLDSALIDNWYEAEFFARLIAEEALTILEAEND